MTYNIYIYIYIYIYTHSIRIFKPNEALVQRHIPFSICLRTFYSCGLIEVIFFSASVITIPHRNFKRKSTSIQKMLPLSLQRELVVEPITANHILVCLKTPICKKCEYLRQIKLYIKLMNFIFLVFMISFTFHKNKRNNYNKKILSLRLDNIILFFIFKSRNFRNCYIKDTFS